MSGLFVANVVIVEGPVSRLILEIVLEPVFMVVSVPKSCRSEP